MEKLNRKIFENDIKYLKKKRLLVIAPHFLAFIHDRIMVMAPFFKEISVIVVHPILNPIPSQNSKLSGKERIDLKNIPTNVKIYKATYPSLPVELFFQLRGVHGLKATMRLLRKNDLQFDMIESDFFWPAGYIGLKIKKEYQKPLFLLGLGYDVYDLPFRNENWRKRITTILEGSNRIVTVSQRMKYELGKITNKDINVINNGFDSDSFHIKKIERSVLKLPEEATILLSVGNLEPVKGHRYLIEAIELLKEKKKDVLCVLVGGGSEYRRLNKMISQKNLGRFIRLIGPQQHGLIPSWMNGADFFVFPSLRESYGVAQLESLACGKPVIATRNGGSEEIIANDDLGVLVETGNSQALSKAILKALDKNWDEGYLTKYAAKFSWNNIAREYIDLYSREKING